VRYRDSRVIEHASVHGHLPLAANFCIDLANSTLPVIFLAGTIDPKSVNVDDGKGAITFARNLDLPDHPFVVRQTVGVE